MKIERLPAHVEQAVVDAAEAVLRELLRSGPMRPRDVKQAAAERGLRVSDDTWGYAKKRLGVKATDLGAGVWTWALPGPTFEEAMAAWLSTAAGRFARYVAERDRLGPLPEDESGQLGLDLVNGDASTS